MNEELYIIAIKDDVSSEDDIFTVKAKDKEDALYQYVKDYWVKDETFIRIVEDRTITGSYGEYFYKDIFNFKMPEGYTTDLTESEINIKVRENIKEYLGEHQEYTDMLSEFYLDESKSFKDLDHELTMILATKMIYEDLKHYIVKEVVI